MYIYPRRFDVIVVGAGHAGIEAALATARLGCKTLLLTSNLDTIAVMSCNPAIGGIAKGQLVREIDALGGEMGLAADQTGIHFRMLNKKHGPAVWSPRAQCDKKKYHIRMKRIIENEPNIVLQQGYVESILVHNDRVIGISTQTGIQYHSQVTILTTGTFLKGLVHIGTYTAPYGRYSEPSISTLSDSLFKLGFEIQRLKTGTPPRINKNHIDFPKLIPQYGDNPPIFFSFRTDPLFHVEQMPCYITHTTELTKKIVRDNLHKSALYSGTIKGRGPRYCPSIEDKIVKFPDKNAHQIFLEPEGRDTEEFYVNGISTSLPEEIQIMLVRSIPGLEKCEIMRFGYAIEYDSVNPIQLHSTLESKRFQMLFLAGQINGTSGYEEAAAQGIIAGINAAMKILGRPSCILNRSDAFIGVLIDDLITKGVDEPYRMFTSNCEYRLQLRQDNADLRLTPIGREVGLVNDLQWDLFTKKRKLIEQEIYKLKTTYCGNVTYADVLRRQEMVYDKLPIANSRLPEDVKKEVEIQLKYEGYITREIEKITLIKSLELAKIPKNLDYSQIKQLSIEARLKLTKIQPDTIGQASRIHGVSPTDIAILLIWLKKQNALKLPEK